MNKVLKCFAMSRLWLVVIIISLVTAIGNYAKAQEKPPRPIVVSVSTAQHLNFGSFIQNGNFGTVTVDFNGVRTASGSIVLPAIISTVTPALFIVDSNPGTLITIINGPNVFLNGSNGGTLSLKIGEASTNSPFITKSNQTNVFVGGTLTVNSLAANPAGNYSGFFSVTFVQQ